MRRGAARALGLAALALAGGCGRARFMMQDAWSASPDAAVADSGPGADAPLLDAPLTDVSLPDLDARGDDAPVADAWMSDAWVSDAWAFDTGPTPDAWAPDAWAADAWAPDAWAPDAWAPDAWTMPGGGLVGQYTFSGDGADSTGGADLPCGACTFFDGGMIATGNIPVPDRPELAAGSYSFALWAMVRSSQPVGTAAGVLTSPEFSFEVSRNSSGPPASVQVYLPRTGGRGRFVPLDTWVHLAMTWDDAGMRFRAWVDGTVLDDQILPYRPASSGLVIRPNLPIDDFVLYDRELTPAELATLAATRR